MLHRCLAALMLSISYLAACSSGSAIDETGQGATGSQPGRDSGQTSAPTSTIVGSTTVEGSTTEGTTGTGTADGGPRCAVVERIETGEVERVELVETSGLAASRRHDGVLWAINDSGRRAGLYGFDHEGTDLGFFALVDDGSPVSTRDVEDLAIGDGSLYLADIGDNAKGRDTVVIYVVDEPDPGGDGEVEVTDVIEVRYPDGPTDAEALIVDERRGQLLILSKDLDDGRAPTRIYTVPLEADDPGVVEATLAGAIDVAALAADSPGFSLSTLLFPGSVTGADLGRDGDLVALRTYGSVWLFRRQPATSVAEALLSGTPCEVGSAPEQQGEAIAFLPADDGGNDDPRRLVRYVTVSEGVQPAVNLSVAEVSG